MSILLLRGDSNRSDAQYFSIILSQFARSYGFCTLFYTAVSICSASHPGVDLLKSPARRMGALGAPNMARAIWGGKVIAESNDTVDVEGNQYFPPDSVIKNVLKSSTHTSICPWKGTAHYYHVEVDGMKNENAAWYYPEPKPAASEIKGRIAFWKGVRVETAKN
jgi:uncharacterized protein (DUF427 family)